MAEIGMTLGDNFGQLMHQMSWEKLFEFDPEGAVKLWIESFGGMTEVYAKALATGKYLMTVDDDKVNVSAKPIDEFTEEELEDYPSFDTDELYKKIVSVMSITGEMDPISMMADWETLRTKAFDKVEFNRNLTVEHFEGELFDGLVEDGWSIHDISLRKALKYWFEHNHTLPFEVEDCLDHSAEILNLVLKVLKHSDNIINNKEKIEKTIRFVEKNFELTDEQKTKWRTLDYYLEDMFDGAAYIYNYAESLSTSFPNGGLSSGGADIPLRSMVSSVEEYLENAKKIDEATNDLKPVKIEDKYDGGLIAPDGTYYGLYGAVANLLHINLANAIVEKEGFKVPKDYEYSADYWLLKEKGFVKITKNVVLFEGYDKVLSDKITELTPAQKKQIIKLGEAFGGTLLFGYNSTSCSMEKFKEIEDEYHMAKLFSAYGWNF